MLIAKRRDLLRFLGRHQLRHPLPDHHSAFDVQNGLPVDTMALYQEVAVELQSDFLLVLQADTQGLAIIENCLKTTLCQINKHRCIQCFMVSAAEMETYISNVNVEIKGSGGELDVEGGQKGEEEGGHCMQLPQVGKDSVCRVRILPPSCRQGRK